MKQNTAKTTQRTNNTLRIPTLNKPLIKLQEQKKEDAYQNNRNEQEQFNQAAAPVSGVDFLNENGMNMLGPN